LSFKLYRYTAEAEYGVLLAAYREAGRWDDAFQLLRRLREDIRTLGDGMADEVRKLLEAAPGWTAEASVGAVQVELSGPRACALKRP
jgi:pentatricopeptide repeat protein